MSYFPDKDFSNHEAWVISLNLTRFFNALVTLVMAMLAAFTFFKMMTLGMAWGIPFFWTNYLPLQSAWGPLTLLSTLGSIYYLASSIVGLDNWLNPMNFIQSLHPKNLYMLLKDKDIAPIRLKKGIFRSLYSGYMVKSNRRMALSYLPQYLGSGIGIAIGIATLVLFGNPFTLPFVFPIAVALLVMASVLAVTLTAELALEVKVNDNNKKILCDLVEANAEELKVDMSTCAGKSPDEQLAHFKNAMKARHDLYVGVENIVNLAIGRLLVTIESDFELPSGLAAKRFHEHLNQLNELVESRMSTVGAAAKVAEAIQLAFQNAPDLSYAESTLLKHLMEKAKQSGYESLAKVMAEYQVKYPAPTSQVELRPQGASDRTQRLKLFTDPQQHSVEEQVPKLPRSKSLPDLRKRNVS